MLAEIYRGTDRTRAVRSWARALSESERMGMRPCILRSLLGSARVRASTRGEKATQALMRRAGRLARAMGMQDMLTNVSLI